MPENLVEMITHVEVTPSAGSDSKATTPVIEALCEEGHKPDELAAEAAKRDVNLLAPAPAMGKPEPGKS
jgi:hypothetical protein